MKTTVIFNFTCSFIFSWLAWGLWKGHWRNLMMFGERSFLKWLWVLKLVCPLIRAQVCKFFVLQVDANLIKCLSLEVSLSYLYLILVCQSQSKLQVEACPLQWWVDTWFLIKVSCFAYLMPFTYGTLMKFDCYTRLFNVLWFQIFITFGTCINCICIKS